MRLYRFFCNRQAMMLILAGSQSSASIMSTKFLVWPFEFAHTATAHRHTYRVRFMLFTTPKYHMRSMLLL